MIARYITSEDAFHCGITDVVLNLKDPNDPFYRNFVMINPGNRKELLMVGAMPAMIKSDLTLNELITVTPELYDHHALGRPFMRDIIPFAAWNRGLPNPPRPIAPFIPFKTTGYTCEICIRPRTARARYCPRCRNLISKGHRYSYVERVLALKKYYDPILDGFLCAYCGVLLEENNPHDPYFIVFDHIFPGQKELVPAAFWVNDSKGWLTADQYWRVIAALTNHIRTKEPFDTRILTRAEWKRALYLTKVHGRQVC
jgi:hypothetical protein